MSGMMLSFLSEITSWLSETLTSLISYLIDLLMEYIIEPIMCIIPKTLYLLWASLGSIGDVFQLIMRKIAGLDVYYVDGKAVSGDLVTNIIAGMFNIHFDGDDTVAYSALATVFWSFVIFGVVLCIFSTIFTIIKGQYNYDDKEAKGGAMQHVYTMIRTLINMAVVPLVVILGLYVSQAILTALDQITTTDTTDVVSMYGSAATNELQSASTTASDEDNEKVTYAYYDIFGYNSGSVVALRTDLSTIATTTTSFSGVMFKTAAYNANRLRTGDFTTSTTFTGNDDSSSLFSSATTADEMADLVDNAFALNLHYKEKKFLNYDLGTEAAYKISMGNLFTDAFYTADAYQMAAYSKYNVSLVWYYYNLWDFNFLVGFAFIIVMLTVFTNIILGLMQRVIILIALFLVMPAAYGITPLDGGEIAKRWRSSFLQYVLGAYGAILGMNLVFLILPYLNEIDFTNIAIVDYLIQSLFIIVGLMSIKALIAMLSQIVGGKDVNDAGSGLSKEIGSAVGKAVAIGVGAATGGVALAKGVGARVSAGAEYREAKKEAKAAQKDTEYARKDENKAVADQNAISDYASKSQLLDFAGKNFGGLNSGAATKKGASALEAFNKKAKELGVSDKDAKNILNYTRSAEGKTEHKNGSFGAGYGGSDLHKDDSFNSGRNLVKTAGGSVDDANNAALARQASAQQRMKDIDYSGKLKAKHEAKVKRANATGEIAGGVLKASGLGTLFGGNELFTGVLEGSGFNSWSKKRKDDAGKAKAEAKEDKLRKEDLESRAESDRKQQTAIELNQKIIEKLDDISKKLP